MCSKKEVSYSFSHDEFSVEITSSSEACKAGEMHEQDTEVLLSSLSLLKIRFGHKVSTQSCLRIYERAYFKTDFIFGEQTR